MSEIGIVGAGKLGLPVALAIESKGHSVSVYDINPEIEGYVSGEKPYPHQEEGITELLGQSQIKVAKSIGELVINSDIMFCAIQTPHEYQFEGSTPIPEERKDFDYSFLKEAVREVAEQAEEKNKQTTLSVISTCLPGTFNREIEPLLNENVEYVYNPLYIAMGTVIKDYLNPEFVLIGQRDETAKDKLQEFYETIHSKPHVVTDITTAEGIKVSYNTWITAKTVLANAWGEMCHKLDMNFDDMHRAWELATDRLISSKYMDSGVGDGGGCHPRDNIALSYLAEQTKVSHNIWEDLMAAREEHMDWLASLAVEKAEQTELPIVVLGRSFKPETNIETGSPARLLTYFIANRGRAVQNVEDTIEPTAAIYVIGTNHSRYQDLPIPSGSIVIDPFRNQPNRVGVETIRIGGKIQEEVDDGRTTNSREFTKEHTKAIRN